MEIRGQKMPDNLLNRSCFELTDLEVRLDDNGATKSITGYAARFESLSVPMYGFREKIRAGAFKNSLSKNNVIALWNHNSDLVLGSTKAGTLQLQEDDIGLRFDLDLPETQAGKDAGVIIKRKDVEGMSFGFRVLRQEWDEKDPKNIIRTLVEVDLREISITPFPAYPSTSVKTRSVQDDYEEYRIEQSKSNVETNENETLTMLRKIEAL
jgi:HK97 family phage prohead protease